MTWDDDELIVVLVLDRVELRIRVDQDGHLYRDFSLQLVVIDDGEHYPVVRYDCGHGQEPHRDILNWDGSTESKTSMRQSITRKQAFDEAHDEIIANWERYVEDFLRSRP